MSKYYVKSEIHYRTTVAYISSYFLADALTEKVIEDWKKEIERKAEDKSHIRFIDIINIIKLDDPPKYQRLQDKGDNL